MSTPFPTCIGATLSADIAVPDHHRELRFYSRVLTTGEAPLWRDDLMNSAGTPIIGLGERSPEYAHLPLQWMPHIQVADVAASVQRALDLGGKALMHSQDDDGNSLWGVLADADGNAAAGICEARGVNRSLPPVWLLYLPVGDLDESVRRVADEGGKIIEAVQNEDGGHASVVIQDPVGAHLVLVPA